MQQSAHVESRWIGALALALSALMFLGAVCETIPTSERIETDEVYGVWGANFNSGIMDEITILSDGRYVRDYVSFDSVGWSDTGRYRLQYGNSHGFIDSTFLRILFSDYRERYPTRPGGDGLPYFGEDAIVDSSLVACFLSFHKLNGHLRLLRGSYYDPGYSKH
ncbi:hypothetical protein KQH82_10545 [bacterium]|nr:hypothetical protein [bacterium]